MMSSSDASLRHRAVQVLQQILGMLSDQLIAQRIDAPIDQALSRFRFVWEEPFSPASFHRVLGEFLAEVRAERKAGAMKASLLADEAVAMLTMGYQGTYASGYDGAVLDVAHLGSFGINGIDAVLVNFAGILKAVRRQQYVEWVYARCLDPFDCPLKCEVAACIVELFDYSEPEGQADPADLAEDIPHLLDTLRNDKNIVGALQSDRLASLE